MSRKQVTRLGLEEPYPSSPSRPPKYVIYTDKGVHTFCALYAAKHALDLIIGDRPYSWADDSRIIFEEGGYVRSAHLEEIMEHEFTEAEAAFIVPEPYRSAYTGKDPDIEARLPVSRRSTSDDRDEPKPKPKSRNNGGLVSVGDIATQLGIEPRVARATLRAMRVSKPTHGWAWEQDEADRIMEQIRAKVKK
jgi:hypothetical protein